MTDYVLLAEGNVDRHVIALARAVEQTLIEQGVRALHIQGLQVGDWIVMDYMHFMVHLFMPGLRDKYQLEQLWQKGKIVDLHIETTPKVICAGEGS